MDPWAPRPRPRATVGVGFTPDLRNGLVAAWRLGSGRADSMAALFPGKESADAVARIAVRSFAALLFCLVPLTLIEAGQLRAGALPPPHWHALTAVLLGNLASWFGFLAITHAMALRRGVGPAWPRFAALWNWSNLTQAVLLVVASVPAWLPFLPPAFGVAVWLIFAGWAVMVEWVAVRLGLGLSRAITTALVALDLAMSLALDGLGSTLTG